MNPAAIRVKICGVTRCEDALIVAQAGADAIGLNFVGGPRRIDPQRAEAILAAVPPDLGVWILADVSNGDLPAALQRITEGGRVGHVQMYGRVSPATLARLHDRGLWTVFVQPVADPGFADQTDAFLHKCGSDRPRLILLDAQVPRAAGAADCVSGGTGRSLDWNMLAAQRQTGRMDGWPPIVLAGGLNPDNVARAVGLVAPQWVDVSSGVEAEPGHKDPHKVEAFVRAAKAGPDRPERRRE